ncbi:hypothetical protein Fmac_016586 [Flemingia macrophylla]|uniref:Leucine-rich repeat-containing N-terminal plant-type domain-containing protein n=1 Tax=Flemingia macrophylla TaxID=520843 RepID=A0ABD1MIM5_9FABA
MHSCRFCLFYVVTVLCIYSCVGSCHTIKCAKTDKEALLKLKSGFLHGRHLLSSWTGDDCCQWKGISCNNLTGRVTKLDLRFSNFTPVIGPEDLNDLSDTMSLNFYDDSASVTLEGKIDSSICELQHLTFLDLSYHHLKGEIPKCIGSLGQLIELKLALNELVGFVPNTFANLSNLQSLDLRYNNLVADDLEWLSHLSNMRYLGLSDTNLSRVVEWPSSISKIPYLVVLDLCACGLHQVTAKSISHMNSSTTLRILRLSRNELNSSILPWVVNMEAPQREARTILGLLTEQMDGVESGGNRRRRMLKERFGFMGCCRAAWANAFRSHHREQPQRQMDPDPDPGAGMNLAVALAAERRLQGPAEEEGEAPWWVSLMRLLEEDDLDPFFSFSIIFCWCCGRITVAMRKNG